MPRPVRRALEAIAQSPIHTSPLAMTECQECTHATPIEPWINA